MSRTAAGLEGKDSACSRQDNGFLPLSYGACSAASVVIKCPLYQLGDQIGTVSSALREIQTRFPHRWLDGVSRLSTASVSVPSCTPLDVSARARFYIKREIIPWLLPRIKHSIHLLKVPKVTKFLQLLRWECRTNGSVQYPAQSEDETPL